MVAASACSRSCCNHSCIFDCHYCINRKSSNVRRARFTAKEVVDLTIAFYKRNYIEGLFLSSGIIKSSNYTRRADGRGSRGRYAKTITSAAISISSDPRRRPGAGPSGRPLRRPLSINVELPTVSGLKRLAPEKDGTRIEGAEARREGRDRRQWRCAQEVQIRPPLRARRPVDADDRRRPTPRPMARSSRAPRRSTIASACAASITARSARSPTPAPCCRCNARR